MHGIDPPKRPARSCIVTAPSEYTIPSDGFPVPVADIQDESIQAAVEHTLRAAGFSVTSHADIVIVACNVLPADSPHPMLASVFIDLIEYTSIFPGSTEQVPALLIQGLIGELPPGMGDQLAGSFASKAKFGSVQTRRTSGGLTQIWLGHSLLTPTDATALLRAVRLVALESRFFASILISAQAGT